MTASAILAWLNNHGRQILIQDLNPNRRQKNRVILSYAPPDSTEIAVVGARDLPSAVERAAMRISTRKEPAA